MNKYLLLLIKNDEDGTPDFYTDFSSEKLITKEECFDMFLKDMKEIFSEYGQGYVPENLKDIKIYNEDKLIKFLKGNPKRIYSTSTNSKIILNFKYGCFDDKIKPKVKSTGPFTVDSILEYSTGGGLHLGFWAIIIKRK